MSNFPLQLPHSALIFKSALKQTIPVILLATTPLLILQLDNEMQPPIPLMGSFASGNLKPGIRNFLPALLQLSQEHSNPRPLKIVFLSHGKYDDVFKSLF